jgi:hypothetical protein
MGHVCGASSGPAYVGADGSIFTHHTGVTVHEEGMSLALEEVTTSGTGVFDDNSCNAGQQPWKDMSSEATK